MNNGLKNLRLIKKVSKEINGKDGEEISGLFYYFLLFDLLFDSVAFLWTKWTEHRQSDGISEEIEEWEETCRQWNVSSLFLFQSKLIFFFRADEDEDDEPNKKKKQLPTPKETFDYWWVFFSFFLFCLLLFIDTNIL